MGQARRKVEMKLNMAQIAKDREQYRKSMPMRSLKALAGIFLFIPLTMISFAMVCFQRNIWPWDRNL